MAVPPFKVKAIYEYTSQHDDDLTFPIGQVITVTELEGDEWYVGEYTGVTGEKHDGMFPSNFVEKYEPEVPARPSRPVRQKQEVQQDAAPAPAPVPTELDEEDASPVAPPTRTQSQLVEPPKPRNMESEARPSPPPAPKPSAAEPAEPPATSAKKPPPPIAAKSNAFKDRIAAFNQPAAAPLAPMQPGRQQQPSNFIRKPFVAPPPSKNAYVPPPKVETVQKPYVREEDPEIKEREEADRAAAEAAGLSNESSTLAQGGEDEDAPKPMTLKERMALLQQQQQEQAQRRAEASSKKKPPPQKKASESSDIGAAGDVEDHEIEHVERRSSDLAREAPRVPSTQRRPPEPMSPIPQIPDHEILSDGHEADQSGAGELTEEDDDADTLGPGNDVRPPGVQRSVDDEDAPTAEEEDADEDEVDEETRRKEELRARMARLGGGMPGMGAPFNPFGAPPPAPPRKKQPTRDRDGADETAMSASQVPQMVPVPGMQSRPAERKQQTAQSEEDEDEDDDDEDEREENLPPPPKRAPTAERGAPPPLPKEPRPFAPSTQDRGLPPPVPGGAPRPPPSESRPVPHPLPPAPITSPGPGSESDDELSTHAKRSSADVSGNETPLPIRPIPPPVATAREVPPRPDDKRASYLSGSEGTPEKRMNRVAPPIPGADAATSPRPPPPPPPTQAATPRRQSIADALDQDEHVGSDYDGDYDTDIASSAKHKDALKAPHYRDVSLTESTLPGDTLVSSPPPLPPQAAAPRAVPPPPPSQVAPRSRQSMDRPPPPLPPPREEDPDDSYDPYRYTESPRPVPISPVNVPGAAPPLPPQRAIPPEPVESSADDSQAALSGPSRKSTDRMPTAMAQALGPAQAATRASGDLQRNSSTIRRSVEQSRPSGEHGQIAGDIDLSEDTPWWTAAQPLPPVLQDRNGVDILSECEETSKSKRGGKKEITKDIYILYMDYSQTVISARYDSHDPSDVQLEQRHEPPPPRLRQDQLEAAWQHFGSKIADAAYALGHSKKDTTVGDTNSPYNLPLELIKTQPNALRPVGTRAYGALVYANLANASTMQYDEIRRGDIITVRNAKFEGHHGAMKSKYRSDYGPSHVAVVEEWDGTRRAVRAWEQGREKKGGVRSEKFRLGDLRSGEVRVWRVVGRDWVGWES